MFPKKIVVGVDGSPSAAEALRWAAAQARLTRAPLQVVYAYEASQGELLATGGLVPPEWEAAARSDVEGWIRDAVGRSDLPPRWSIEVVAGSPGQELVEQSRHAGLLVIGTHEHVGLQRLLSGSVSHYCLTHAVCPVVAVPAVRVVPVPSSRRTG